MTGHPAGTAVIVSVRPPCDICRYVEHIEPHPAYYDGATAGGSWANMCEPHFQAYGRGLGLGVGQRLLLADDPEEKGPSEWPADAKAVLWREGCADDECRLPAVVRFVVGAAEYGYCAVHGREQLARVQS